MKNPFRQKTAADMAAEIEKTEAGMPALQAAIAEAAAIQKAAIIDGEASAIAKAEKAVSDSRKAWEHATIRLEGLRERHAELAASEHQAERLRSYNQGKATLDKIEVELETLLRRMTADADRAVAIAEQARLITDEGNANLPDGMPPLVNPDLKLRTVPPQPEEIVSALTVEAWCHPGTWNRIPIDMPVSVHPGQHDLGIAQKPGGPRHDVERRLFKLVRFRRSVSPYWAAPLDEILAIPALAADLPKPERPIEERWEPVRFPASDAA